MFFPIPSRSTIHCLLTNTWKLVLEIYNACGKHTAARVPRFARHVSSHGYCFEKYLKNKQLVFQGCSKCHQNLRGVNADILSIGTPRTGTEHREIGHRLNELERAGKKTQKENLETDTGIRYKLENIFGHIFNHWLGTGTDYSARISIVAKFAWNQQLRFDFHLRNKPYRHKRIILSIYLCHFDCMQLVNFKGS